MRFAILDTKKKEVLNVIKGDTLASLPKVKAPKKYVESEGWMSKGKKYSESEGVLSEVVIVPTAEELAEQVAAAENCLYQSCLRHQNVQIDINMNNEFVASRGMFEVGEATPENLPIAAAVGEWIKTLWGTPDMAADPKGAYYAQKGDPLTASGDFSALGDVPGNFASLMTERETFKAGL